MTMMMKRRKTKKRRKGQEGRRYCLKRMALNDSEVMSEWQREV